MKWDGMGAGQLPVDPEQYLLFVMDWIKGQGAKGVYITCHSKSQHHRRISQGSKVTIVVGSAGMSGKWALQ